MVAPSRSCVRLRCALLVGALVPSALAGGEGAARQLRQSEFTVLSAGTTAAPAASTPAGTHWGDRGYCAQSFAPAQVYHTMHDDGSKWVEAHNHYRRCHDAPDVKWDHNLTKYAKAWVTELLTHCNGIVDLNSYRQVGPADQHRPHDPMSFEQDPPNCESIAGFDSPLPYTPVTQATAMTTEATSVENWYREIETECPNKGVTPGCGGIVNHYTAMLWKSVTHVGCYSAARGNFKVVSCRYSVGAAGSAQPQGCQLPNTVGCAQEEVPALKVPRCSVYGGGVSVRIPLKGPVGNVLKPILNPEGGYKPKEDFFIKNFVGDWTSEGGRVPGVTTIIQNDDNVTMVNDGAHWSPAEGVAQNNIVTFRTPPKLFGVTGMLSKDGQRIELSTGVVLKRSGAPPTLTPPEPEPEIVIGIPSTDALPDGPRQVVDSVEGTASGALASVSGAAWSARGWLRSRMGMEDAEGHGGHHQSQSRLYNADTPSIAAGGSSASVLAVAFAGAILVAAMVAVAKQRRRRDREREVQVQQPEAALLTSLAGAERPSLTSSCRTPRAAVAPAVAEALE